MKDEKIVIGIPTYNGQVGVDVVLALFTAGTQYRWAPVIRTGSLLAHCFNQLWCDALASRSKGYTHFLMMHADIQLQVGFVDTLMKTMQDVRADVLSAVIPIKNWSGLTSTAVDNGTWSPPRFSMQQIMTMPETFTSEKLLVNTGLMLVDIRKSWVDSIHFHIEDRLVTVDGKRVSECRPEDWNFSRDARALGAKVWATRAVTVRHIGTSAFGNDSSWGQWATDLRNGAAQL